MRRTTITRELIELVRLGTAQKEHILRHLAEGATGAEALRHGDPAVTVTFHKLRVNRDGSVATVGPQPAQLARGTEAMQLVPLYEHHAAAKLYQLADDARVDLIRFGRHPDQDVQLLDRLISREHGLVILADQLPLFCDYGTLIDGVHAGSTNGTYLDGSRRIHDTMLPWFPGQQLMLGEVHHDRAGGPHFAFKLSYEIHPDRPQGN